jgi:hypothetical protein
VSRADIWSKALEDPDIEGLAALLESIAMDRNWSRSI